MEKRRERKVYPGVVSEGLGILNKAGASLRERRRQVALELQAITTAEEVLQDFKRAYGVSIALTELIGRGEVGRITSQTVNLFGEPLTPEAFREYLAGYTFPQGILNLASVLENSPFPLPLFHAFPVFDIDGHKYTISFAMGNVEQIDDFMFPGKGVPLPVLAEDRIYSFRPQERRTLREKDDIRAEILLTEYRRIARRLRSIGQYFRDPMIYRALVIVPTPASKGLYEVHLTAELLLRKEERSWEEIENHREIIRAWRVYPVVAGEELSAGDKGALLYGLETSIQFVRSGERITLEATPLIQKEAQQVLGKIRASTPAESEKEVIGVGLILMPYIIERGSLSLDTHPRLSRVQGLLEVTRGVAAQTAVIPGVSAGWSAREDSRWSGENVRPDNARSPIILMINFVSPV